MELERLWLERFYAHRDLEIDFTVGHRTSPILRFLVGPNGSGKSRVLESLARIFSHLSSGLGPEIGFELRYAIGTQSVVLTTRGDTVRELLGDAPPDRLDRVEVWLLTRESAGAPWVAAPRWPSMTDGLLPQRIVTLSSGPASRFAWAVAHSRADRLRREMAQRMAQSPPPHDDAGSWFEQRQQVLEDLHAKLLDLWDGSIALEVQPDDALLAVLAVLTHSAGADAALREQLLERVRVASGQPIVAFTVDVAGAWRERVPELRRSTLEHLRGLAVRRVARAPEAAVEEGAERAPDEAWVFAVDEALGRRLRDVALTPQVLFEQLLAYKRRGAIQRVQLLLAKTDEDSPVLHEDLSDGELLLLGRYCVLTLYRDVPNCLVLLDEPETHFNDDWKVRLVRDLEELLRSSVRGHPGEVLVATHSDLTLTDAEQQDVYVLDPGADGVGAVMPRAPSVSPLAADRDAIAQGVFQIEGIGERARMIVDDALGSSDLDDVRATIERLGPGFSRFRLAHHLRELMGDGNDAA